MSCGRLGDGKIKCWGANGVGQLGIGANDMTGHGVPQQVAAIGPSALFDARHTTGCIVDGARDVWCWGSRTWSGTGSGPAGAGNCENSFSCQPTPAKVAGIGKVKLVSTGREFAVALDNDGKVLAWGANLDGRLGHAPGTDGDLGTCGIAPQPCNQTPKPVSGTP
jgi:alpha-tubulin suppressor-like RCC1 family protein